MNIKKISAAAMAAAVLAVAAPMTGVLPNPLGVTASAEEMKLLTIENPFGEYDNASYIGYGYYSAYNSKTKERNILYVGRDEIANFRKNGKLEYKTVECPIDLTGKTIDDYVINEKFGYIEFGKDGTRHAFYLDMAANKLTEVETYTYEGKSHWCNYTSRADGYRLVEGNYDSEKGQKSYTVIDPTGKKVEKTVEVPNFKAEDCDTAITITNNYYGSGKYVGYIRVPDGATKKSETVLVEDSFLGTTEEVEQSTWEYAISGIKKDGTLELLQKARIRGGMEGGDNFIAWGGDDGYRIMTLPDGKIYKLETSGFDWFGGTDWVVGSKAIVIDGFGPYTKKTHIVDLNTGKILLTYSGASPALLPIEDGSMYIGYNDNNDGFECQYLNSNLEVLGTFEYCDEFKGNGKYAPVVKDGKGWLVDKNMNQVSEKIDAVDCVTIGEELFRFETEDYKYIYAIPSESGIADTSSKPEKPEDSNNPSVGGGDESKPEDTSKPAAKVEFKNESANAAATANEGVIPAGAQFSVKELTEEKTETGVTFDLSFTKDGKEVQPSGSVEIKLPVPESLKDKAINVYRVEENGKYTKLTAKVEGDFVIFTTSHFSKYLLTTENIEDAAEENPNTGLALVFPAIALSGAAVLVARRKRK